MLSPSGAMAELQVSGAYVRGLPPGQSVTAAFMQLRNTGPDKVLITAGATSAAERVELHAHRHNGDLMRMERLDSICIAAGERFDFSPGGYHLMLVNLRKPLRDGDKIELQLYSGEQLLTELVLPVRSVLNEHKHNHHNNH